MKKRFNFRFTILLVAGMAALAAGAYLLHGYQFRRNAAALRHVAEDAEAKSEFERAAKYYRLYLRYEPTDNEALAHRGIIECKLAATPKARLNALFMLDQVLRREPQRHEVRRLLVEQALHPDLQRFRDAKEHLIILCATYPNEAALKLKLARSDDALGNVAEAAAEYADSIHLEPALLEAYRDLAELQARKLKRPADAAKTLDRLVAANPGQARALLFRAQHLRWQGSLEISDYLRQQAFTQAAADLKNAALLGLDGTDKGKILLESAELSLARGQLDRALAFLDQGLKLHPNDIRFHLAAARVAAKAERRGAALIFLRKGLEQGPENKNILWALAQFFIQDKNWKEAEAVEAKLRQGGVAAPMLEYLNGYTMVQKGEWRPASRLLKSALPQLSTAPVTALDANLLLAKCHAELCDTDEQVLALRRALAIDPSAESAALALGEVLLAREEYEKAFAAFNAAPNSLRARFRAVQALTLHNLALAPGYRRWPDVERLIDDLALASPDAPEPALLRADVLAAQNQPARATAQLAAAMLKNPGHVQLWVAHAGLLQRQEKWPEALDLLDRAETKLGRRFELTMARINFWTSRGGPDAAKALKKLEPASSDDDNRQAFTYALAHAWLTLGSKKEAASLCARLAARDVNNLIVRTILFDLAMEQDEDQEAARLESEMRRIEGEDGVFWRFGEACRLLRQARVAKTAPGEEVRRLLKIVAERKPKWNRLLLAEAEFELLSGRPEGAIRKYQQAVDSGERDPQLLRRAVVLLHERGRFLEADELMQKAHPPATLLSDLNHVAADLALFRKDFASAAQLARKAVLADSKDYHELLWLGHMLCATEQWSDAEAAFRRAVAIGEKAPETWVTLAWYLSQKDRTAEARKLLDTARDKVPSDQLPLMLAQGSEALKQPDQARQYYEAALKARPDDVNVLRNAARFSLTARRLADAEHQLRTIIELKMEPTESAVWAKRMLALVLVADGRAKKVREALAVLGIRDEAELRELLANTTSDEQRIRAIALAAQPNRAQRQQAIVLLEPLARKEGRTDDRFLLAQLYLSVGETRASDEQILNLLAEHPNHSTFLSFYAHSMLARKLLDELEPYMARLEKTQGGDVETVRLRVSLLKARGAPERAVPVLKNLVEAKPEHTLFAANLLEELGQQAASEEMFRQIASKKDRPEDVLLLADFLGRQKRVPEALEICEEAWQSCPPQAVASTCVNVLVAGQASSAECGQVADLLEKAREKWPNSNALLSALAVVRRLEGRLTDAATLYQELLKRDPNDANALNNLAWLLAISDGKAAAGLDLIQQAIKIAGPEPSLLDTRGMILLSMDQTTSAIRDLEAAVAEAPTANRHFHLAQAYFRAGQRVVALVAWQRAVAAGLQSTTIDPLEAAAFEKLEQELTQ